MEPAEFFVEYIQWLLPTWLVRVLVRLYIRFCVGWRMRCGDVVVQQIKCDRELRNTAPVTTETEAVNEQLYGNDPNFYLAHLGPRLKYSASEWRDGATLTEADTATLLKYQQQAGIQDLPSGSRVLELGCGWGSLSLANAAAYPSLSFTSFSNSPQQIEFITERAQERGITNLTLVVEDYADFIDPKKSKVAPEGTSPFDLAFAIETVEHAQNIQELLHAVALRLRPGARFFVQSLLHQSASYLLDRTSWMGRNFFSGGSILSLNSYFHLCPPSLRLVQINPVSGVGYSKTLLAWLQRMEPQRKQLVAKFGAKFYEGFRMFYISCAEAFAANNGNEFMVAYYLFQKG